MSSTFGTLFRVTTFGESHCPGVGAVVDGCPPRLELTEEDIQVQLDRRRPGQSRLTTERAEEDRVRILSGVENGRTLGTPLALFVANRDVKPADYKPMSTVPRPSHADYTYQAKYGVRAASGGGRASARETVRGRLGIAQPGPQRLSFAVPLIRVAQNLVAADHPEQFLRVAEGLPVVARRRKRLRGQEYAVARVRRLERRDVPAEAGRRTLKSLGALPHRLRRAAPQRQPGQAPIRQRRLRRVRAALPQLLPCGRGLTPGMLA
jgi:hypothetical protein